MTREEKISHLKGILSEINENDDAVCYLTSEDSEVIKSAIEALEQESCDNCISRQAAIDALDKRFDSVPMEQTTEILLLRKDLRDLPPVQPKPKTGHWISYWDEEARCYVYKCPECGNKQPFDTKHCWECGARLDAPDINVGRMSKIPTGSESEDKE